MKLKYLLLCVPLLLAGCDFKDTHPPYWQQYCAHTHSESKMVYWPSSGGPGIGITPYGVGLHVGGGMHLVNEDVCDHYEARCVWGSDYTGEKVCKEAKPQW